MVIGAGLSVIKFLRAPLVMWVRVAILSDSLIVDPIDGRDLASLVVASQQGDVRRVLHLEAEEHGAYCGRHPY